MRTWAVDIPGRFRSDVAFVDLETVKVPCDWRFPSGERLGRRWSAFLAGVSSFQRVTLIERTGSPLIRGDEEVFLRCVRREIGVPTVVYCATRSFDEMVLKGRYTYARRGPAPEPFYPAMPGAETLKWDCRRPERTGAKALRERELESKDVSATYYGRGVPADPALVRIHLLRDVVELIAAYGEPDETCAAWCRRVLTDRAYSQKILGN